MFRYVPFVTLLQSDELGTYSSFGINAVDSSGYVITSIQDVSAERTFVESICRKCNDYQLSPVHLLDVVSDSL